MEDDIRCIRCGSLIREELAHDVYLQHVDQGIFVKMCKCLKCGLPVMLLEYTKPDTAHAVSVNVRYKTILPFL